MSAFLETLRSMARETAGLAMLNSMDAMNLNPKIAQASRDLQEVGLKSLRHAKAVVVAAIALFVLGIVSTSWIAGLGVAIVSVSIGVFYYGINRNVNGINTYNAARGLNQFYTLNQFPTLRDSKILVFNRDKYIKRVMSGTLLFCWYQQQSEKDLQDNLPPTIQL